MSNGFRFGDIVNPLLSLTFVLITLTRPKVCCINSNATLCLNSFCSCFAANPANAESCESEPSEPLGLSESKILKALYVDGRKTKVESLLAYASPVVGIIKSLMFISE